MEPESYQQSMTSGVRCISPPHFGAGDGDLVDVGAVQLDVGSGTLWPSSSSSLREPMTCMWPHSHTHTGSGVPQ